MLLQLLFSLYLLVHSRAAQDPGLVEPGPSSSSGVGDLASVLAKKPDYEALLTSLPNLADTAELMVRRWCDVGS